MLGYGMPDYISQQNLRSLFSFAFFGIETFAKPLIFTMRI